MGGLSWALAGIAVVVLLTFLSGLWYSRRPLETTDFLVAKRIVSAPRNAAAISGEYLSAASFLGVAGLVLKQGVDALWYPIGYTAGYLALLIFVAAPLRRSGAYTIPDFVQARLDSPPLRRVATGFVLIICWLYLVPQLQGAGLTLKILTQRPEWEGAILVAVLVLINVLSGGMRTITLVQAMQYWVKLTAIMVPAFVLCIVFLTNNDNTRPGLSQPLSPTFPRMTTVSITTPVRLHVSEPVAFHAEGTIDGHRSTGVVYWTRDAHDVGPGSTLTFEAGSPVPVVDGAPTSNAEWFSPASGQHVPLSQIYSLIFATFLGTMGLPHVLVRFYTNPDGKAARTTTLYVLMLLGLFYLFPTVLGMLSRLYVPELLVSGNTDAAVLLLPSAMMHNLGGQILTALPAAGAFAAFLSTSSGLVVSIAGVLSTDVLKGRVRDFRFAALPAVLIPLALALVLRPADLSLSVGMAFALAASTFCPILLLGIWWRRITPAGAMAGMLVGGGLVVAALGLNIVSSYTGDWSPALLLQPAVFTVPIAFLTVVGVSRATKATIPENARYLMARMHAPDALGLIRDRDVARWGTADEQVRLAEGRHRE